jgi:hypothetical protein
MTVIQFLCQSWVRATDNNSQVISPSDDRNHVRDEINRRGDVEERQDQDEDNPPLAMDLHLLLLIKVYPLKDGPSYPYIYL